MTDLLVLWEAIGMPPGGTAPARAAVRVPGDATIESWSRGVVTEAAYFERDGDRIVAAADHGMFDEQAFGPLRRLPDGSVDFAAYQEGLTKRPQARHFGALRLSPPLLNPWARRLYPEVVAERCGVSQAEVDAVLDGRLVLDGDDLVAPTDVDSASFGAEALAELADARESRLPWLVRRVPIMPAGLRAPKRMEGSGLDFPWFTGIYHRFLGQLADLGDDEDNTPLAARATRAADMQRLFECFLIDGFGDLEGLVAIVRGSFGADSLALMAGARDADALVLLLRGELYFHHAYLKSLCLEVVPVHADGEVDEETQGRLDANRIVNDFGEVYERLFGAPHRRLVWSAPEGEVPHVHVELFGPRADGEPAFAITAGLSSQPLYADDDPFERGRELLCFFPHNVADATRETIASQLLALARRLATGDPPPVGPIVPGSPLTHWLCLPLLQLDWLRLSHGWLLGCPALEVAVGVSEDEHRAWHADGELPARILPGALPVTTVT